MTLQRRIRDWLGILHIGQDLRTLREQNNHLRAQLKEIKGRLDVLGPGLGRVIAKLDAKFTETEFSAERKAESDKLGEEALRRLAAEAKAREPYNE